jgi:SAM-dependent methyltransferase
MSAFWNELGDFWVETQQRLDERLRPYGEALLQAAAPAPGELGLDIGCGCGDTTLALARLVAPAGAALGLDVSAPMIAHARKRADATQSKATFVEADAGRFALPPARFDLAISRFGVMFFEDPTASFAHIRRALKPGGRLVFVCWRGLNENPWMRNLNAAVSSFAPPASPPSPEAPGPFSLGDPERVRRILVGAGFKPPEFTRFDCLMDMGPSVEAAVAEYTRIGSIATMLNGLDERSRLQAIAAIHTVMETHSVKAGVRMGSATWIVRARTA